MAASQPTPQPKTFGLPSIHISQPSSGNTVSAMFMASGSFTLNDMQNDGGVVNGTCGGVPAQAPFPITAPATGMWNLNFDMSAQQGMKVTLVVTIDETNPNGMAVGSQGSDRANIAIQGMPMPATAAGS